MKSFLILSIIIFSYSVSLAQNQPDLQFLISQQSPLLYGAGNIGAAIPMQDPAGFYFNPAQLGYYSQNNSFSASFMPDKMNLYQGPWANITTSSYGITAGYNFKSKSNNLPLAIGAGFLHNIMNYNFILRQGQGSPSPTLTDSNKYSFNCFSIGASYDYYLIFNLGFSVKSYNSAFYDVPTAQTYNKNMNPSGTAFDFGTLVIAPIDKLFFNDFKMNMGSTILMPILRMSMGYSILNAGNDKFFSFPGEGNPLLREARLGYNINLGFKTKIAGVELPVIDYSFTAEAEDLLINIDTLGNYSYKGLLGDINIARNLILLNGSGNVIIHKGHIFSLFKTLTIVTGRISGERIYSIKTGGWAVSSEGMFSVLANNVSNTVFNYLFKHFYIEYYKSKITDWIYSNPQPEGIAVYFRGIRF